MKRGFTLIELLVVIAIVGILSSVIYTNISGLRERSRITASMRFDSSTLHTIGAYLVAQYDIEEGAGGSGTAIGDQSGNGNTGTISTAGTSWSTDTFNTVSKYSLNFSGTDYITISKGFDLTTSNFTFTEWIKTTSGQGQMNTISNTSNANGYRFGLSGGQIYFLIGDASGSCYVENACGTKTANDGKWHHIAGVFDRTNSKFICYMDGSRIGSANIPSCPGVAISDNVARIGKGYITAPFVGQLDNVRIYNTDMEGAMIRSTYQSERNEFLVKK